MLVLLGLFGAALLYGDGVITPAISVLAAVEGTAVAEPDLDRFVVPLAVVILIALFVVQRKGTASIGKVFGPVMVVWFVTIGVLGAVQVVDHPDVLRAIEPSHAVTFFADNGFTGFLVLGAVILVVVGGEALYADMGHFGRRPILFGWYGIVLPSLLLVYFGQGALLIHEPSAIENPFYRLAPDWALVPLVVLATVATVIASQALISGAFSLTRQAVQLGYSPRVHVQHTSATQNGQIYIASVNWLMMVACIGLVLGFQESSKLAAAYGLAVTTTMVITTLIFFVVVHERFQWRLWFAVPLCAMFFVVDVAFFGATLFKIPDGGWFPLVAGAIVFTVFSTWRTGHLLVSDRLLRRPLPLREFVSGSPRTLRSVLRARVRTCSATAGSRRPLCCRPPPPRFVARAGARRRGRDGEAPVRAPDTARRAGRSRRRLLPGERALRVHGRPRRPARARAAGRAARRLRPRHDHLLPGSRVAARHEASGHGALA